MRHKRNVPNNEYLLRYNNMKQKYNERATVSKCVSGFEPVFMYYYMFSTSEVSPAYGIFHYVLKKGKKQMVII